MNDNHRQSDDRSVNDNDLFSGISFEDTPAEDQTQGVLSHEDTYNAENVSGISGIPGTDTNAVSANEKNIDNKISIKIDSNKPLGPIYENLNNHLFRLTKTTF